LSSRYSSEGNNLVFLANNIYILIFLIFFILRIMVYKYRRIKKQADKKTIDECIQYVNSHRGTDNKISLRAAAKQFHIKFSTFQRHFKAASLSQTMLPPGGFYSLPVCLQVEIADVVRMAAKNGFGLSKEELKVYVGDIVEKHWEEQSELGVYLRSHCQFKKKTPSNDWVTSFMNKHHLSLRTPSSMEKSRVINSEDPFIIYEFFDLLENEIKNLALQDKPSHIYNCDESSFFTDPSRGKVVALTGEHHIHRTTSGSGRESYTVLACIAADGSYLPPLVIFCGKHFYSSWHGINPYPGTMYAKSGKKCCLH
jgi:hypothetical protein